MLAAINHIVICPTAQVNGIICPYTSKRPAVGGTFKSKRLHIARNMFTLVNFSCHKRECRVIFIKNESSLLAVLHSIVHHKGFYIYYLVFYVLAILCFTEIDVFLHKVDVVLQIAVKS